MEILEASLSGVPILRITGEVDHYTSPLLDQAIQRVLPVDGSRLLLDLTDCDYLDSGGLAVLLLVVRRVRTQGWLGVIGANANLIRLFEIVGLKTEPGFRVFGDEKDASAALVVKSS